MQERLARQRRSWQVVAGVAWVLVFVVGSAHGQTSGSTSVGYIDSAIPLTQFRLRVDAANDDNRPERAAFFYPSNGLGPVAEPRVNFQELSSYLEVAVMPGLSVFAEIPFRWIDPEINDNHHDLSDINFGFKYALIYEPDQVLTLQLRTFVPTGDVSRGLGTGHWTFEPALLYNRRLSDNLILEAELRDWAGLAGRDPEDFVGNIIRYGVGLSYQFSINPRLRVSPVLELVGWTLLSGKDPRDGVVGLPAAGETIINAKFGVRVGLGEVSEPGATSRADLYVGYGRALTGDVWYKNMLRVELRFRF
jgi:hypothetical protein